MFAVAVAAHTSHKPAGKRRIRPKFSIPHKEAHITGVDKRVRSVHQALWRGTRLCCLRGMGGVGKSTTAWECVLVCTQASVVRVRVCLWLL